LHVNQLNASTAYLINERGSIPTPLSVCGHRHENRQDLGNQGKGDFLHVMVGFWHDLCDADGIMLPDPIETITRLDDWQTIICCRGLVLLMDQKMAREPGSARPADLSVTDFNQWVQMGDGWVQSLLGVLCEEDLAVTAATGRYLMQTCVRWGYRNEVRTACHLVNAPVNDLGTLSPVTIVTALVTVMRWHPDHPAMEALPPAQRISSAKAPPREKRRYPWFEPLPAKREEDETATTVSEN
jgi:hypothetical protein